MKPVILLYIALRFFFFYSTICIIVFENRIG